MSKPNTTQKLASNIPQKSRSGKLTPKQARFIQAYGQLIQEFRVPEIAALFGVSKQAAQNHIDKNRTHEPIRTK